MYDYSTIIIVNRDVYAKIELYRQFLEKSDFGTLLDKIYFISNDSAEELSSAGLNNVKNCLYLYGLLDKDAYADYRAEIEEKRKQFANTNFYMLFCQNKGSLGNGEVVKGVVRKTFSIGIIEETDSEGAVYSNEMCEDIRCLKLLSLVLAICKFDKEKDDVSFNNYYITANIDLNFKNVYYAILYKLSEYVTKISEKKAVIDHHNDEIETLKKQKPYKCSGIYSQDIELLESTSIKPFDQYKSMEDLRKTMENTYDSGTKAIEQSISSKITTARRALAVEEDCVDDETADRRQVYMTKVQTDEKDATLPYELLDRPDKKSGFDAGEFHTILPLAREFEKQAKPRMGKIMLWSFGCALAFAISAGLIYGTRYLRAGFNGVDLTDVIIVLGVPVIGILLSGIIGYVVQFIQHIQSRNIFKELYKALVSFLTNGKNLCETVRKYVDKYITVYYNYHLKHSRIKKLSDEIVFLEKDIEKLKEKALPLNEVANSVCRLSEETLEVPQPDTDIDGTVTKEISQVILEAITESKETTFAGSISTQKTSSPWIKNLCYGLGNINSNGGTI